MCFLNVVWFVLFLTRNPFYFLLFFCVCYFYKRKCANCFAPGRKIYLYVFWLLFFYKQLFLPPPTRCALLWLGLGLAWFVLLASANISMCERTSFALLRVLVLQRVCPAPVAASLMSVPVARFVCVCWGVCVWMSGWFLLTLEHVFMRMGLSLPLCVCVCE